MQILNIPVSILLGIILGIIIGLIMIKIFKNYHIRDTEKVLLIISASILLTELGKVLKPK